MVARDGARPYLSPIMAKKSDPNYKVIAENRRARFDYDIESDLEVGIILTGSEVKSLRTGQSNIAESYASVDDGELWLINGYIAPYEQAGMFGHEERRRRKLLVSRKRTGAPVEGDRARGHDPRAAGDVFQPPRHREAEDRHRQGQEEPRQARRPPPSATGPGRSSACSSRASRTCERRAPPCYIRHTAQHGGQADASDDPKTLVSTDWLAAHLNDPDLRILDASLAPAATTGRDARAEYDAAPYSRRPLLRHRRDQRQRVATCRTWPRRRRSSSARMRAMGVGDGHQVVVYDSADIRQRRARLVDCSA